MILIAEDDPKSMKLVRDLLQISGYTTIEASDGRKAILLARDKQPDLILMDIQMPVIDGLEATKILKADEKTSGIPIIALTAYAMKEERKKIEGAGCDDYIVKPINTREFLKKVSEYLYEE